MTEEDWGIVIGNNSLTSGYTIVTRKDKTGATFVLGAERSIYPGESQLEFSSRPIGLSLLTWTCSFRDKGPRS